MIPLSPSLRRTVDLAIAALAAAVVVLFAVMVALVFLQVVDRFTGLGWFWTEEVVRILLVWSVMFGLPVVLYHHEEIRVDVLSLPDSATRWRIRIATVIGFAFLAILAWQGWIFTLRNANFTSPSLGISRAWMYLPMPAGAALGCLVLLVRAEDRAPGWPAPGDAPHKPTERSA
jgi:TRAP-type transport system small permease protein